MIKLLDVSGNQGRIAWPAIVAGGIGAVLVKASEGVDYEDSRCRDHCDGVRRNQLELGTYLYLRVRHGKPQDAREQVRQYLSIWVREACTLRPCLDFETAFNTVYGDGPNRGHAMPPELAATRSECAEAITAAVDECEKALHVSPLLYTSKGEWESMLPAGLSSLSRCPLWIAAYGSHATPPDPWTSYVAWQYSCTGTIAGALVRADGSTFDGPFDLSTAADLAPLRMPA